MRDIFSNFGKVFVVLGTTIMQLLGIVLQIIGLVFRTIGIGFAAASKFLMTVSDKLLKKIGVVKVEAQVET